MLETMEAANGIGLAAPQVGVPIQLAVVDVSHDEDCVSYLRINGADSSLADAMPTSVVKLTWIVSMLIQGSGSNWPGPVGIVYPSDNSGSTAAAKLAVQVEELTRTALTRGVGTTVIVIVGPFLLGYYLIGDL